MQINKKNGQSQTYAKSAPTASFPENIFPHGAHKYDQLKHARKIVLMRWKFDAHTKIFCGKNLDK
jgi:hypothetical protein